MNKTRLITKVFIFVVSLGTVMNEGVKVWRRGGRPSGHPLCALFEWWGGSED